MQFTQHAYQRFRERILADMSDEAIAVWFSMELIRLASKKPNRPYQFQRRARHDRIGRKITQDYLPARAPNGRLTFLAVSDDREAITTVLNLDMWIRIGCKGDDFHRQNIIRKLKEAQ